MTSEISCSFDAPPSTTTRVHPLLRVFWAALRGVWNFRGAEYPSNQPLHLRSLLGRAATTQRELLEARFWIHSLHHLKQKETTVNFAHRDADLLFFCAMYFESNKNAGGCRTSVYKCSFVTA